MEENFETGILYIHENNNMSLSCHGKITIKSGIIRSHNLRGMPRSSGDGWVSFFKNIRIGQWVSQEKIKSMLRWNGQNNVVATFKDTR